MEANAKNAVTLDLKTDSTLPVEADAISPDLFAGLTNREIRALPLFYGRRRLTLEDLFHVKGEKSERIIINGNVDHYKRIGQAMTCGEILINGNAGMHTGAYMAGGNIFIKGNAKDWLGAHMKGGFIRLSGNAGNYTGAGYVGEKRGANHGTILIEGSAGNETGARMRRGLIVVMGDTGDFTGANLIAGTIMVLGRLGGMPGPGNKRGSIIALGEVSRLLPTYSYQCLFVPFFLSLYQGLFKEWGLDLAAEKLNGYFQRFAGDINTVGKGEILIYDKHQ
jgi:formylmethanofuran dehydrogenase subunit C